MERGILVGTYVYTNTIAVGTTHHTYIEGIWRADEGNENDISAMYSVS